MKYGGREIEVGLGEAGECGVNMIKITAQIFHRLLKIILKSVQYTWTNSVTLWLIAYGMKTVGGAT